MKEIPKFKKFNGEDPWLTNPKLLWVLNTPWAKIALPVKGQRSEVKESASHHDFWGLIVTEMGRILRVYKSSRSEIKTPKSYNLYLNVVWTKFQNSKYSMKKLRAS